MSDAEHEHEGVHDGLTAAERKALLERCREIPEHRAVRLTWDSSRGGDVTVEGRTVEQPEPEKTALYVRTDERDGDLVVKPISVDSYIHGQLRVISTGKSYTNRQVSVGSLIDVEVLDRGADE